MFAEVYISLSRKKVQIISECKIYPDMQEAVCYQELEGDYQVLVMKKKDFYSKFKPVSPPAQVPVTREDTGVAEKAEERNILLDFLDAATYEEKINIMTEHRDDFDDHMLNNMAVSLDIPIIEDKDMYSVILNELRIKNRYEIQNRLRS
ncbi:MAG: hypothetical protein K6G63_01175 [Eubacterium sp.]|nr:hypothetical protein [Eubacterium sp.]